MNIALQQEAAILPKLLDQSLSYKTPIAAIRCPFIAWHIPGTREQSAQQKQARNDLSLPYRCYRKIHLQHE